MNLEHIRRGNVVCRVTYGITLYLPEAPTRDEILRAYSVYRTLCPPERRKLITTARLPLFLPMADDDLQHVNNSLAVQDSRRDEGIVIWDGRTTKQWLFWMQGWVGKEVDTRVASFCQILLPEDNDCKVLYALVHGLADELPIVSGHAGYTVQFDGRLKESAFNKIYGWAKRYLGVEVEDLNLTLPLMLSAVKGANWLTLVGSGLWERWLTHPQRPRELPEGVVFKTLRHARLFVAGEKPVCGDRNRREFPVHYAAVDRLLKPIKLRDHPEFAGRFNEQQATNAWLQRLLEPDAW